jgi:hypothetical protein
MLSLVALVTFAPTLTVHVSPTGDDTRKGSTATAPVRTIERALALAREARKGGRPATISLAEGTYTIEKTIALGREDGGVAIRGAGSRLPRLVGGVPVTGWRPVEDPAVAARLDPRARGQVRVAEIPADLDLGTMERRGFGLPRRNAGAEVFFEGRVMPLARYPNGTNWLRIAATPRPNTLAFTDSVPSRWKDSPDLWVMGYWQFDWAESYEPVKTFDRERRQIGTDRFGVFGLEPGRRFRFLNALEALDEPGEWYLDRAARRLYFWSPEPKGEVLLSRLDAPMIRVEGASDVVLADLALEGGRANAIDVTGGGRNRILRCLVRNFGTYGISLTNSPGSEVTGCDLRGLGEYGISLSGGDRKTLTAGTMTARDNHIFEYSRWTRTYQPAVLVAGVGQRVEHNLIHDAPHNAVLLSGNDHRIEFNQIYRVCRETGDAGAIYMGRNPTMRGNEIRFNRFYELAPVVNTAGNFTDVMAVYLDDAWCGTTIYGNVFEGPGTGIMIGGGRDNSVENNLFVGNTPAIHFDARGKGWAAKMMFGPGEWDFNARLQEVDATRPPYRTRYPQLATYATDDPAFPKGNRIVRNVSVGGRWLHLLDQLTERDFVNEGNVQVTTKRPYLAYALRAVPKGFRPIPMDQIGLVGQRRPSSRL